MVSKFEIRETDEAGRLSATYIGSGRTTKDIQRVDLVLPPQTKSIWAGLLDVFLPAGFPHSVTEDYVQYQIYDSLQAFASTMAGLLSSRAVLEGVGVGDASASPTAAMLLSIFQESTGRIATIVFAHRLGTTLEPECKMYRLAADFFNDAAMILDCLSPAFPKTVRVLLLSTSSTLRALCGVAAGSSKASLSAHFARWGNLGELNAKDSSQETVISLVGMLCGSLVVSRVKSFSATWITLLLLLSVHLLTNYAAVRSVQMRTLNRQRANIVLSHLIDSGHILNPMQVARRERIFERDSIFRWRQRNALGYGIIGASLETTLKSMARKRYGSGSFTDMQVDVGNWQAVYEKAAYLLWFDDKAHTAFIVLKRGAKPRDQLQAWTLGLLMARQASESTWVSQDLAETVSRLREGCQQVEQLFVAHKSALEKAGWDLETSALETRSGTRVEMLSS